MRTKRIEEVLNDWNARYWLKGAIRELLERDCVDACADAELLAELFRERLAKIEGQWLRTNVDKYGHCGV